jgi:hypothetical protein
MVEKKSERSKKILSNARLESKVEKELVNSNNDTIATDKNYVMDLRVHSPLALGWRGIEGVDSAPALVKLAKVKGIDVIALTDFYSGAFVDQLQEAARSSKLLIIPGFDMRCCIGACKDSEITCLLPENFSSEIITHLLKTIGIPEESFGDSTYQVEMNFTELVKIIEANGGVILPTRMDRTPIRRSVLPLLVEEFGFRTFDLAHTDSVNLFKEKWPNIDFNLFTFSNARVLAQIGSRTVTVPLPELGFAGVRNLGFN